jgi:hypothetical protein
LRHLAETRLNFIGFMGIEALQRPSSQPSILPRELPPFKNHDI